MPPNTATRAHELNAAISRLWQDQATHDKDSFNQQIVPIYTELLKQLRQQNQESAEQQLLDLLKNTAKACRYRWTKRLPLKRPGSDYRKYEIIYTDALVTTMAVEQLKKHQTEKTPEHLADQLLPNKLLKKLKSDPIVWEDWLGYFQQSEKGGLYAIAIQKRPQQHVIRAPKNHSTVTTQKPPPPGSGRAMLEAIKAALADGTLSYNQPGDFIQVDRAGRTFLEHPKVLKWCVRQLQLEFDIRRAKAKFSRLQGLKRNDQGRQLHYGRQARHDRRRVGYVLENPALLWRGTVPSGTFSIERAGRLEKITFGNNEL